MKCIIPEISWHNRDPVLSVDIQPAQSKENREFYRLASGGTDSHVLIWHITNSETGTLNLDIAADLTRHQRAVNVVRWSPSGEFLASGDDESVIFIWKLKSDAESINILDPTHEQDKEIWLTHKIMRGHMEDVYDLSWSPNSMQLISGSVDNTAMIWDVSKGKSLGILDDHKSFVQGVAWDPQNQYVATFSTDRYFRVFDATTKKVISRSCKCTLPVSEGSFLFGKEFRIFHDDTLQTFYRRLSFSPDGELIVTPSGVAELYEDAKPIHTSYIYTRYNTKQPVLILPSPDQYTIAVRFCPLLFILREYEDGVVPVFDLPYRMVFAIATKSSVYLYDTQQPTPLGIISNIHYTRLTDLAWSNDGRILIVSSTDGFCTLITFAEDELGTVYTAKENTENDVSDKIDVDKKCIESTKNIDKQSDLNLFIEGVICIEHDQDEQAVPSSTIIEQTINTEEKVPQSIAIRRKPKPDLSEPIASKVIILNTNDKTIALEIPKGIISSKDKFDSPECINKPVTPIQVRRAPRTPGAITPKSTTMSTGNFNQISQANTSEPIVTPPKTFVSEHISSAKAKSNKKPTPIAVRRQQRVIITTPSVAASEDVAMDAWPIDQPRPTTKIQLDSEISSTVASDPKSEHLSMVHPADVEETEDIRLVYDDVSQCEEEVKSPIKSLKPPAEVESKGSPSITKTPRRVELRTISTPKSKKKLL